MHNQSFSATPGDSDVAVAEVALCAVPAFNGADRQALR
jgi:hypothetical protein